MAKFTANLYRMNVSHLEGCELEYELILRGLSVSEGRQDNERRLRAALREDEKENRDYLSWRGISEECAFIETRLREIEDSILRQANLSSKSRLYHYYLRLRRCQIQAPTEEENRFILVDIIKEMLLKYFNEVIANKDELYMQTTMDTHNSNVGRQEIGQSRSFNSSIPSDQSRSAGAIPKVPDQARRVAFLSSTRDDIDNVSSNSDSLLDDLVVFESPNTGVENPLYRQVSGQNIAQSNITQSRRNESNPPTISSQGVTIENPRQDFGNLHPRPTQPPVFVNAFNPDLQQRQNTLSAAKDDQYVHVSQIESYIQKCVSTYLGNLNPPTSAPNRIDLITDQLRNINIRGGEGLSLPRPQAPREQISNPISSRSASGLRKFSVIPNNLNVPPALSSTERSNNMIFNRTLPSQSEIPHSVPASFSDGNIMLRNPFDSNQVRNSRSFRNPPHHLCKIIGTWPKFCGDNNTVPLVSFLRTIDMLCRSYEVDKEELKPHAHLLFTGDAYTWYTTYVERFTDWNTLLYYLTIRYDNPNRDRYIKEEMRNRKQKPYELFSAFLTEIEALSQRLINPMPDIEKFDLVVENMKISYKRRLALEDIRSIEDLAQKCYRFDALESNLFTPKSRGTNADVHALSADEEDYEDEYVNALQTKGGRRNPKQAENKYGSTQNQDERPTGILCWNCQGNDHIWKFCPEEKRIFCHVCGQAGKTSFNCPNNHPSNPAFAKEPKNGFQENV